MKNIVLIGMPGAGKSTMGVILAKALRRAFVDADIVIQEQAGRLLQDIIDEEGTGGFLEIEENAILSLHCRNAVIATGGSVVFSKKAMEHLKTSGVIIYLRITFDEMEKRLRNITTRGIVVHSGQDLHDMYNERVPLYEKYADLTVDCSGEDFEDCVGNVIEKLKNRKVVRPGG
jgi:shikimate kinase